MLTFLHRFVKTYERREGSAEEDPPLATEHQEQARRDGHSSSEELTKRETFVGKMGSSEDLPALRSHVREETERMLSRSESANLDNFACQLLRGTSQDSLASWSGSDCSDVCNFYRLLDVDPEMRMAYMK